MDGDGASPQPVTIEQNGNTYTFHLPPFTTGVWYDPTIGAVATTASGAAAAGPATLLAALALAAAAYLTTQA